MYAVIVEFERNSNTPGKSRIVEAEKIMDMIDENTYLSFETGKTKGDIYFFNTLEEAEKNISGVS